MCMYVINICYHILKQFVYIFFRQFFMQNPYIFANFVQKLYKKLLLTSPESYVTIKLNPISYAYSARHGVRNDRVRLKTDVPPIEERRKT